MKSNQILHLFGWDRKFFLPFRDIIQTNFADGQHQFIVYGDVIEHDIPTSRDTLIVPNILKHACQITKFMHKADKIIIHGLFNNHLLYLLSLQPWLLKKCYWVVWGGDLYTEKKTEKNWRCIKNELFRKFVIPRMGYYVTGNTYDYRFIHEKYGGSSPRIDCICYPSNVFDWSTTSKIKENENTVILVGNSADRSNNHTEIFSILQKYSDSEIEVICPLSYGDDKYANEVIKMGEEFFGNKFFPLRDFIPYDKYLALIEGVDIAVFAHKRQQAFGNKIQLLGMGKKVFLRKESSLWEYFEDNDIKVFDFHEFNLEKIDIETKMRNQKRIVKKFSKTSLLQSLHKLFDSNLTKN